MYLYIGVFVLHCIVFIVVNTKKFSCAFMNNLLNTVIHIYIYIYIYIFLKHKKLGVKCKIMVLPEDVLYLKIKLSLTRK